MKVYCITPDDWDYDDFDGIVVVAKDENNALTMVETGYFGRNYFKSRQGKINIKEVDLTKEHIVMESRF